MVGRGGGFVVVALAILFFAALPEHHHANAHEGTSQEGKEGEERGSFRVAGRSKKDGPTDADEEENDAEFGAAHTRGGKDLLGAFPVEVHGDHSSVNLELREDAVEFFVGDAGFKDRIPFLGVCVDEVS